MTSLLRSTFNLFKSLVNLSIIVLCFLGKPLFDVYYSSRRKAGLDFKAVKKIAVFHFDGSKIGDAINSTAVIEPLKKNFPNASIHVVFNKLTQSVVKNNPHVDKVIVFEHFNFKNFLNLFRFTDLKRENYDLVFSLSDQLTSNLLAFLSGARFSVGWNRSFKGAPLLASKKFVPEKSRDKHEAEYYCDLLRLIGVKVELATPRIYYGAKEFDEVSALLAKHQIKKKDFLVGIHAGAVAFYKAKMWPWRNFAQLIDWLIEKHGAKVFLVGRGGFEENINRQIKSSLKNKSHCLDLTDKTSLDQLIALIARSNLFVSNDSGPMHMAAAQARPLIAFFGPTDAVRWGARTRNSIILSKELPCSPCDIAPGGPGWVKCPHFDCMASLSFQEVAKKIESFVSKTKKAGF